MRVVVVLAVVLVAAFAFSRWQSNRAAQEAERREQQAAKEHAEWQKQQLERRQREDQRVATLMNCSTAANNVKVLEEAMAKGTGVEQTGPGLNTRQLQPFEVSAAYQETRQFIDRNCR